MHTEQQGQSALFSLARILLRSWKWGISAAAFLMVATICLGMLSPVQAAEKETGEKPAAARHPADDLGMTMLARARPSGKDRDAILMPLTGSWNYVELFWTSPKAQPLQAMGFVTNDMVMDGHYLSSKIAGARNTGVQQLPLEGQELIGFDDEKKTLSFVAVDNVTAGMTVGAGKYEEKAVTPKPGMNTGSPKQRTIWESGRFTNPVTGVEQGFHSEIQIIDDAHYKRTISAVDNAGHETKLLETDYTKK